MAKGSAVSVPDHELDEPPEPEPCTGLANGCDCDDCGFAWRELFAEWKAQDDLDELPYAN